MENESLKEADRLIEKAFGDFTRHVAAETDLTVVLLRGHLLIEHYIGLLLLLEYDKAVNIDRLSFAQKIEKLAEARTIKLESNVIRALYRLNDLRNRVSHDLDFKISTSEIDTVGSNFGRKYVLEKYKSEKSERVLLMWTINEIIKDIFYYVYAEVVKEKGMSPIPKSASTALTSAPKAQPPEGRSE